MAAWDQLDHSPAPDGEMWGPVLTLYPASPDTLGATAVTASPGRPLEGVDITLLQRRMFRVAGRVVGAASKQGVALESLSDARLRDHTPRTATRNAAGDFAFVGIPAGSYRLVAGAATKTITVAGDVEGALLELSPGTDIQGRFLIEGEKPANLGRLGVFLTTDGRHGHIPNMKPDLSFAQAKVAAGRYEVRVYEGEPRGLYLKTIRAGETDVLAEGLTLRGGTVALEIVMASGGARVEGVVTNADGEPLLGATVALVPREGLRERWDLYRTAVTDQLGRYSLDPAAPGDYKVFAWQEVEEYAWRDPDFLKEYEKRGEGVTLEAGGRQTVKLQVLPMLP